MPRSYKRLTSIFTKAFIIKDIVSFWETIEYYEAKLYLVGLGGIRRLFHNTFWGDTG